MLKIAICDDDAKFCKNFQRMLTRCFEAIETEIDIKIYLTGEALCADFSQTQHDLIFLDIELTGINGVNAGQILRQTIRKRADRIGATLTTEEKDMRHLLTLTYKLTTR